MWKQARCGEFLGMWATQAITTSGWHRVQRQAHRSTRVRWDTKPLRLFLMCQPGTCCPGAFWSLVILCDFEAVASQGIVGICWNSHWTRPGFWMHTSRDFQVEHETWVDRNHGKRKIGRKTCLIQIPSTYPLLPSTKPGVALILKAPMVEPHFPRHEIVTVRYLDNCVDDMQETTTAMFGSLMSGQARTDAGNQGFEMAGWDWNLPLKPP